MDQSLAPAFYPFCSFHWDFILSPTDILSKCKGDLLETKDGKLKTQPLLLENLIFFTEVSRLCFVHNTSVCIKWFQHVLFCADGVHSVMDGESLCQDLAAAEDKSAEEEKEEEKGGQCSNGTVQHTPSVCAIISLTIVASHCVIYSLLLPAASGGVWLPGAGGELAGCYQPGPGTHKRARDWHHSP